MPPEAAADFATFVWFVLSATERLGSLAATVDLFGAVRRLLAFVQLPADIEERWIAFAEYVEEQFELTPPASRLRWTITGTGLRSARRIEQIAIMVADEITAQHGEIPESGSRMGPVTTLLTADEAAVAIESAGALERILELPESGHVWRFKESIGPKKTIDVSVTHALHGWLAGLDMPALSAEMLPTVPNVAWRLEQTVDAVSGTFEHFLSWTLGVVTAQANAILVERGGVDAIPGNLPYLIRYGVDTKTALNVSTSGVRSRRVAYAIGVRAEARSLEWGQVREWLSQLHIAGWRQEFGATPREIDDLAEFCRSAARSPLRQLLEDHETTIDLADPMAPPPPSPLPVALRITSSTDPVEVWTLGILAYRVGIVAAASHTDVQLLRSSGVEYFATTNGTTLTLRETR